MNRRTLLLIFAVLLGGCATGALPLLLPDDTSLPAGEAFVVIAPAYKFGAKVPYDVQIELTRIERDDRRSRVFFKNVPNLRPSLIALPPGVYHLSALYSGDGYARHDIGGLATLFEVAQGQLNYPGTWKITGRVYNSWVSGTVADGSASFTYSMSLEVDEQPGVAEELRQSHPKTSASLPMTYTWIDLKSDPRARQARKAGE
jgi:hypothetical protein